MKYECELDTEDLRNQLKSLIVMRGLTLTKLKNLINKKYKKSDSMDNLSRKLRQKTLKVTELLEMLDILNCKIIIKDKNS